MLTGNKFFAEMREKALREEFARLSAVELTPGAKRFGHAFTRRTQEGRGTVAMLQPDEAPAKPKKETSDKSTGGDGI